MAQIGSTDNGGVTRLALSNLDRDARNQLNTWMIDAGLSVRVDDFGNMVGRRDGLTTEPPLLIGSHLDTVRTGGKYDGALGVLGALEVVRTLNDNGVITRRPIEIVNWTNEEGTRFQPSILGSGAVTGRFEKDYVYSRIDEQGIRFGDELERIGYLGLESNRPNKGSAYIELHIEQGSKLEDADIPVGVVEGIVADTWIAITIEGRADHAGPSPMNTRHDALVAAAELILGVNKIAKEQGDPSVGTVGRLTVEPNVINTIPGRVAMSVDLRHDDSNRLTAMVDHLRRLTETVADTHGVTIELDRYWTIEPTYFASEVFEEVAAACKELGIKDHRLWSGAGHDAKYAADRWPSCMIFARSQGGLSHSEAEYTTPEDVADAVNVLLHAALRLAQ